MPINFCCISLLYNAGIVVCNVLSSVQRVHDYMKSIEPQKSQRSSITMSQMPTYYGKTSRTFSYPRRKGQAKSSSRSIWSWLFGGDKNADTDKPEEVKINQEIRSPLNFPQQYYQSPGRYSPASPQTNYNPAQPSSSSGYKCPYMTYQSQRKRK